ncbi:MAG: dienelactone hydrolase family protein [Candidatus Velthaea sp.]
MADLLDPTNATSMSFNRKAFVGLGAGAAGVAATIAAAVAQAPNYGKPHDPIVAENDPAIVVERINLVRPDTTLEAYAAYPKSIAPATPGVVIVQAIWGVDAQIRDTARRFAKEGFIAIAPGLFERTKPPSGDNATDYKIFLPAATALKDDVVTGDLLAAHDWVRTKALKAKIGITGFCMGGSIVLKQIIGATHYHAASMFYGDVRPGAKRDDINPPETFAYTSKITTPLMGSFGGRDTGIKPDDVLTMASLLKAPHDIKIYDEAGHAFFDDTRSAYVASAAFDAWTRTLAWFRTYLT